MASSNERLIAARKLKYASATDAANALGVPEQTYYAHENGSRGFGRKVTRYADFFGVNILWLMSGQGPMKKSDRPLVQEIFDEIPPEKQSEAIDYLSYLARRRR